MKKVNEELLNAFVLAEYHREKEEHLNLDVDGIKENVLQGQRSVRRWRQLFVGYPIVLVALVVSLNGIWQAIVCVGGLVIYLGLAMEYNSVGLPFRGNTQLRNRWNRWVWLFKEFEKYFRVDEVAPRGSDWIYYSSHNGYSILSHRVEDNLNARARTVVSLEAECEGINDRYACIFERRKLSRMYEIAKGLGLVQKKIEAYFPKQDKKANVST